MVFLPDIFPTADELSFVENLKDFYCRNLRSSDMEEIFYLNISAVPKATQWDPLCTMLQEYPGCLAYLHLSPDLQTNVAPIYRRSVMLRQILEAKYSLLQ